MGRARMLHLQMDLLHGFGVQQKWHLPSCRHSSLTRLTQFKLRNPIPWSHRPTIQNSETTSTHKGRQTFLSCFFCGLLGAM